MESTFVVFYGVVFAFNLDNIRIYQIRMAIAINRNYSLLLHLHTLNNIDSSGSFMNSCQIL